MSLITARRALGAFLLCLCGIACTAQPTSVPGLITQTADRYLEAWQSHDWEKLYRMEGKGPEKRPYLHRSLTDRLEWYTINEVRYADSAAACALTLRWRTGGGAYVQTGELYLRRRGTEWRITGFKGF